MDKSKRDPNDSPSSQTPENHRAKRLNTQGSPNAVDSTIEQDEQRFIRRTGPYVSYKPSITHEQWKSIIGSHVPLDRQTVAYHTSGWKAFVDFMARNIREGRSSMYDGNLELFIVCSRVYRCSPISIFSPFNGLSCDVPFSDQTFGDDTESAWWSTSVRKLTKILTHSVFRGNLSHLVTVIQYAIILRTDDRRRWVITKRSPIEGGMLEMLRSHIKYAEVENGMLKRPRPEKPEGGPDFDQLADFYCRAWHFEERKIAESTDKN
ncbi:hypothetical protein H9Q72_009506 [Fusarium xylarioides]|uniref:Uncharacterized protein n=1 Tax=Fusarium xylarioides TaxID=221167 RepID=A0A9P7HMT7_9HYPO|nr:hypothetical protein H9Q72_009506 [Fusarium xylarioides]